MHNKSICRGRKGKTLFRQTVNRGLNIPFLLEFYRFLKGSVIVCSCSARVRMKTENELKVSGGAWITMEAPSVAK